MFLAFAVPSWGLAQLVRAAGHQVTGCDAGVHLPMSSQLEAAGIELVEGYGAEQIGLTSDCFVIGNTISRYSKKFSIAAALYVSGPQ